MTRSTPNIDRSERTFTVVLAISGGFIVLLLIGIMVTLFFNSLPAIREFGAGFFIGKTWNAAAETFGALPFLVGTLVTSFLALLISVPFSLAIALFLGE